MKKLQLTLCLTALFVCSNAQAAGKNVTLTGKLPAGYGGALLYTKLGYSVNASVKGSTFSIKAKPAEVQSSTLILLKRDSKLGGAVILSQRGQQSFVHFSKLSGAVQLGAIVASSKGYPKLKSFLSSKQYDAKTIASTKLLGAPLGLNPKGVHKGLHPLARGNDGASGALGLDSDHDGIPDGLDVDANADGGVDVLAGVHGAIPESPYLIIEEELQRTINVSATGVPTSDQIDAAFAANEVNFNMGFIFSAANPASAIVGAHVVCDDASLLCGRTLATSTTNNMFGGLWRNYHPDGTTYPGLDLSDTNNGLITFNTGVTLHSGPSAVLPGDTYRIEFTNASGATVTSKVASVAPYLVTVPAIHSFTANSVTHEMDYSAIATEPGADVAHAVTLGTDGLLTVSFWRPQRQQIGGSDGVGFEDVGGLRYGFTIVSALGAGSSGIQGDPGCIGFYSGLSSTLTAEAASPKFNPWPLDDSAADSAPSSTNLLSFTVDLKQCILSNGLAAGQPFKISLQAAGADLGHGANRSGQNIVVYVP